MAEENQEYFEAANNNDLVEVADALGDMLYILCGTIIEHGMHDKIEDIFKTKTRDEWCNLMEGTDVCFSPVLSINEAPNHQHNIDRKTFVEIDGVIQPNVAPRFSRTESKINGPSVKTLEFRYIWR